MLTKDEKRGLKSWAAERAIPIDLSASLDLKVRKLAAIDHIVGDKRIAFVGESDHFIHEKYAYRELMLAWLAKHGFTNIGEEIGVSDGTRIDRFLETGNERYLDRVTIYGYREALRPDRDDLPKGILRDAFGGSYPLAEFAAEQKRFAHGIRQIGQRLESRLRFFGFDIDALPGGGYEDLAELLEPARGGKVAEEIVARLARVPGESLEDEIHRLDAVLKLIEERRAHLATALEAKRADEVGHSVRRLRDSFEYVRLTYPARTWEELNPGMAYRERQMHHEVDRVLTQMAGAGKIVLMSHNMHLAKDDGAYAGTDVVAGAGGGSLPSLGTYISRGNPGAVFSVWMLVGRGRDSQPFGSLSNEIRERSGTLNAILGEIGECFMLPIDSDDPRASLLSNDLDIAQGASNSVRTPIASQADAIFFARDVTPLRR